MCLTILWGWRLKGIIKSTQDLLNLLKVTKLQKSEGKIIEIQSLAYGHQYNHVDHTYTFKALDLHILPVIGEPLKFQFYLKVKTFP